MISTIGINFVGNEVKCENLDKDTCAFAVSSTGKRCVLEQSIKRSGIEAYTCRSSEIEADKVTNIIESDECIKACGLDRKSLGISSDALLESKLTKKLCSVKCLTQCPNVVDLFFNLAAGEGTVLLDRFGLSYTFSLNTFRFVFSYSRCIFAKAMWITRRTIKKSNVRNSKLGNCDGHPWTGWTGQVGRDGTRASYFNGLHALRTGTRAS